jgi:hypothetical protein
MGVSQCRSRTIERSSRLNFAAGISDGGGSFSGEEQPVKVIAPEAKPAAAHPHCLRVIFMA